MSFVCQLRVIGAEGSGSRKRQAEGGSPARIALDRDVAAHRAGEVSADREPEAGPLVRARERAAELHERLEDRPLLLEWDPGPAVAHGDGRDFRADAARHLDRAGRW